MASVFVFGFDVGEAAQIRRIRSLRGLGHQVSSATMRRENMNADFVPDWPNLDLGHAPNENFLRRVWLVAASILKMARHRQALAETDAIVARNFDMLVIAWAARLISRRRQVPLVYECLDIHGLFTRRDTTGRLLRWCERRLLERTSLLVVSSPGFLRHYFRPIQGYQGPFALIENKLWFEADPVPRPSAPRRRRPGNPLTLGWVGSIRCAPSSRILLAAADAMGSSLRIRIHGNIHRHALPHLEYDIGRRGNVEYFGPYSYPDGLKAAYGECDVVWAQDLWQRGANSDWLLPNRIYEASWFGVPSIAVAGTETGRRVSEDELGFVIDKADSDALTSLLRNLNPAVIDRVAANLLARDPNAFRLRPADIEVALAPVLAKATKAPNAIPPPAA
jgi:succinoglycan biosynthesis protein ExoL